MGESVRQIKVMISSTRADLAQYRTVALEVIRGVATEKAKRVQLLPVSMEYETPNGNSEYAVAVSERWVDESDWVVLIVAWHYGTIPQVGGVKGLSVTEQEYDHAVKLKKKTFIFVAGEKGTADQYRVTPEERADLKDWIQEQTDEQKQKLVAFKTKLGVIYSVMFSDLGAFRERLQQTLRNAVDDLPPAITPGEPLAELFLKVTPEISACTRRVKTIARCKRVHDHLHELLQNVVRRLREEVLTIWQQEGHLSEKKAAFVSARMNFASKHLGAIRTERAEIDPALTAVRVSVDALLSLPDLWDPEAPQPDFDEFTEVVETFASAVQETFVEADRGMTSEEHKLSDVYQSLLAHLREAQSETWLSRGDERRLAEELEHVAGNRERVRESLIAHNNWQQDHDKLWELDGYRETPRFERRLANYCGPSLTNLTQLVDARLQQVLALKARAGDAQQAISAVAAGMGEAVPTLEELAEVLKGLKIRLEALGASKSAADFDATRRPFNDAFYCVDKSTMYELQRAQERSEGIEKWIGQLEAVAVVA